MKKLALLLILGGCASGPTLEELKQEALITGDWSEVEKKEKMIEQKRLRSLPCNGRGRLNKYETSKWGIPVYDCY